LTTIAQATSEMGASGTRLADELVARVAARVGRGAAAETATALAAPGGGASNGSNGPSPAHLVLPVSLRVRDSTGPAPH
jgi:hypothetical protein